MPQLHAPPIQSAFCGHTIYECPPSSQGAIALLGLNIVERFRGVEPQSADWFHHGIEASRLALAAGLSRICDPEFREVDVDELLSKHFAADLAVAISPRATTGPIGSASKADDRDTSYVAVIDAVSNGCSLISSLYRAFGSGIVVPGTGLRLQNRGSSYSLDISHVNRLEPRKKPFHTIIPGMIGRDGRLVGSFGVVDGHRQAQAHIQLVRNMLEHQMQPQAAIAAPRFALDPSNGSVAIEATVGQRVLSELRDRGHNLHIVKDRNAMEVGVGQVVAAVQGVLVGGTDPRKDGQVATW